MNGVAVASHEFSRGRPHFMFEDLEITDLDQIEDRLVVPAHAITPFRFQAAAGANLFTVAVAGAGDNPLRVAGLLLAPDTPAGAAFLDAHAQRQHAAIVRLVPPRIGGRRGPGPGSPSAISSPEPPPAGAPVYPRDLPRATPPARPPGEVLAAHRPARRALPARAPRPAPARRPRRGSALWSAGAARCSLPRPCSTAATSPRARSATARCGSTSTTSAPTPTCRRPLPCSVAVVSGVARPLRRRARRLHRGRRLHGRATQPSRSRSACASSRLDLPPLPVPCVPPRERPLRPRGPRRRPAGGEAPGGAPRRAGARRAHVSLAGGAGLDFR